MVHGTSAASRIMHLTAPCRPCAQTTPHRAPFTKRHSRRRTYATRRRLRELEERQDAADREKAAEERQAAADAEANAPPGLRHGQEAGSEAASVPAGGGTLVRALAGACICMHGNGVRAHGYAVARCVSPVAQLPGSWHARQGAPQLASSLASLLMLPRHAPHVDCSRCGGVRAGSQAAAGG